MSIKGFNMPGDSFFYNLPGSLNHLEIELAMYANQQDTFYRDGQIDRCLKKFPNHRIQFKGKYESNLK